MWVRLPPVAPFNNMPKNTLEIDLRNRSRIQKTKIMSVFYKQNRTDMFIIRNQGLKGDRLTLIGIRGDESATIFRFKYYIFPSMRQSSDYRISGPDHELDIWDDELEEIIVY